MSSSTYTTGNILNPDGIDHIRMRPGMWLGGQMLTTAAREVVDNAADEIARGYGSQVDLIAHDDGSFEVRDNGRGLPIDFHEASEKNGIVLTLGTPMAGANFEEQEGHGAGTAGTHGVGASATNAISSRFDVTVFRGGKAYRQCFHKGRPGHFDSEDFDPNAPFTRVDGEKLKGIKVSAEYPSQGTWVRFAFDPEFSDDADDIDIDMLVFRAKLTAWLREGMSLSVTRDGETATYGTGDHGSAVVLKETSGQTATATITGNFTYGSKNKAVAYDLSVAPMGEQSQISSVNTVFTPDGGAHVNPVFKAVGEALSSKQLRGLKRATGEPYPGPEDFAATCALAVNINTQAPKFNGQEKKALDDTALGNAMRKDVAHQLTIWASLPANSASLLAWAEKALEHARTARKLEDVRKAARAKNKAGAGTNLSLPEKLLPCKNSGRGSGAEIFICEGDSALGTVKDARYSDFQAAFPLRGKPINSHAKMLGSIVKPKSGTLRHNEEFRSIEAILGAGVQDNCDPEQCRYDSIIFATDADPDGMNISASLLNMFYGSFRPLLEHGMVYIAVPPLFIITTDDPNERVYAVTEADRDEETARLRKEGRKKVEVQRCKGLGEMRPKEFRETVMNPATRTLIQVSLDDQTAETLDMMFGPSAALRREWIDLMRKRGVTETVDISD